MKSAPQSTHLRTLSWNSIERCSLRPTSPSAMRGERTTARSATTPLEQLPWVRPAHAMRGHILIDWHRRRSAISLEGPDGDSGKGKGSPLGGGDPKTVD